MTAGIKANRTSFTENQILKKPGSMSAHKAGTVPKSRRELLKRDRKVYTKSHWIVATRRTPLIILDVTITEVRLCTKHDHPSLSLKALA